MKTAVLTDSTSDLGDTQAELLGIHVILLNVHFDGHDWLDHQELRPAELFRRVAAGAEMPSTSPPSPERYRACLEELLGKSQNVLAIHLSSKLSETYNQAQAIAQEYGGRVTVVDSQNATAAMAMQAERAVRLLREGYTPQQIQAVLHQMRGDVRTHMCLDTLAYLRKNGRIGGATTLVGGLLNLKPVVGLKDGSVAAYGRALGPGRAMNLMSDLLKQYAAQTPNGRVAFFHNGNPDAVEEMKDLARQLLLQNPFNLELGTVLSAHGGPGVYGFSFEPVQVWHDFKAY